MAPFAIGININREGHAEFEKQLQKEVDDRDHEIDVLTSVSNQQEASI